MIDIICFGKDQRLFSYLYAIQSFSIQQERIWERVLLATEHKNSDVIILSSNDHDHSGYFNDLAFRKFKGLVMSHQKCHHNRIQTVCIAGCERTQIIQSIFMHLLEERSEIPDEHQRIARTIPLAGNSAMMRAVRSKIATYAAADEPVLMLGETGTGKNIAAQAIHTISSRTGRYVELNCSTLSHSLFESELFGHAKGSFTGALQDKIGFLPAAQKGTLFLDEIGDIPLQQQPKLLKVLEEKTYYRLGDTTQRSVDVRFVCATNRQLLSDIQHKRFRDDLYYRINSLVICIPPLREHLEDIPELASYYFTKYHEEYSLSPSTIELIQRQKWPGNVRELFSFLSRCVICSPHDRIISLTTRTFDDLYMPATLHM
ncbi:MAG: sigma 54-interacting transcriptional regulator [Spirochaetia bacterium]|nr:sigma 54-interacting transcriptional regulator [Spirochaetia bacterium]